MSNVELRHERAGGVASTPLLSTLQVDAIARRDAAAHRTESLSAELNMGAFTLSSHFSPLSEDGVRRKPERELGKREEVQGQKKDGSSP